MCNKGFAKEGENSFDYLDWDSSLRKKAVTSRQLDDIINQHVKRKPDEHLTTELIDILKNEYNLNSLKRRKIVGAFNRYYTAKLSSRDSELHRVSSEIKEIIDANNEDFTTSAELEDYALKQGSEILRNFFPSAEDFSGAFLYELISYNE